MLELNILNEDAVNKLEEQWTYQLDEINKKVEAGFLYSEVNRTVALCEKHAKEQADYYYSLTDTEGNIKAVAEILNASRSKDPSFKFLTVYLEPNLSTEWRETLESSVIIDITKVLVAVIIRAVEMASNGGQSKLKIFNRTEEMNRIFDVLLSQSEKLPSIKLYKQSKWLIIELEEIS
ncbi:hypothetical protein [methanotrophic endosymbiont of Bathymodiolus puteoserpentis (Logatchev)]|uniref:hypothetical protein n=1 Tax=methanotrophic endosymbiont of Bathymodiolus puteoserpentis (Logatchev) TaxID=343235 RepID=UPI0013CD98F8|nr:hypothetical protein [methanotrophic endosymbiont of Bathymodiolus puteoserpentis (Logatchev)]SHE20176.1 hypothetical protein BPUTEOMOX_2798 [methanotrophic endosymbiont of Bathymodiolus puteoserpentis (Logatchev)]